MAITIFFVDTRHCHVCAEEVKNVWKFRELATQFYTKYAHFFSEIISLQNSEKHYYNEQSTHLLKEIQHFLQ